MMKLTSTRVNQSNLQLFIDIIMSTELGRTYYPSDAFLKKEIEKASDDDEMLLLTDGDSKELVGGLWINRRGAFHSFPFLHVIAIKENCQGQGYGRTAMDLFEDICLSSTDGNRLLATKAFLLVNSNNNIAIKMYEKCGYVCVGEVPGLFRKRVNEKIMMKNVRRGTA
ncbi:GNAT family N-acetyltransferase [Butyrivibrio sp. LB2008]|uniref:GNAT family N-acetyltransferase n=1 Tax=Butyrivibrio sp. LB2008 TaxID=1408305 RepID=UPI0009DE07A9|nr:GNAT family N-acetyltransferase [Butyrivibrio sp. LB2008]